MARPRALENTDIFALARQLVAEGEQPSITKIAEKAKAEYGVTPSYTTLKHVLHEWRQVEAANAPKALPAEFLDAVLTALTPLYGRLVSQARAEFEPQFDAANRERDEAEAERDRGQSERARLVEEVTYLRRQVEEIVAREQLSSSAYAELSARAATTESELASSRARNEELLIELRSVSASSENAELARRRESEEMRQQRASELSQIHQTHASALRQMLEETEQVRREAANEIKQRDEQISMVKREHLEQRATAEELRTRLQATQNALDVAQTTLDRQAKESASFASAREQLIAELRGIREEHQTERRTAQARIESLEKQIGAFVNSRSAFDDRYERLLNALNEKGAAK